MIPVITEHIQITPGICSGKPRIAGHRIRVQDVVVWYEQLQMSPNEIINHYPSITLADVHAALAYYYDHRDEIWQDIQESKTFVNHLAQQTPSLLQQKLREHDAPTD